MEWQLWAGPGVGVAALAFGVYTYLRGRKPKRLQHRVVVDEEIIAKNKAHAWADLSVRFDGRVLTHPRMVVTQVQNTGKVEARPDDFEQPITISVDGNFDKIVAAAIALHRPEGRDKRRWTEESYGEEIEALSGTSSEVVAPQLLLNPGEILEFRLLVEEKTGRFIPARRTLRSLRDGSESVSVSARIAGFTLQSYPARRPIARSESFWRHFAPPFFALAAVTALLASAASSLLRPEEVVPEVVGVQVDQAVNRINEEGIQLGAISQISSDQPVGIVLSSSPAEGQPVLEGEAVALVVSAGP